MELHLSEYDIRKAKAATLKRNNITAYAPKFKKKNKIDNILESHEGRQSLGLLRDIEDILVSPTKEISTAGRLTLFRSHGKLSFGKLSDESGEIQCMFHRDTCKMLQNRFPHKVNKEHQTYNPSDKHLRRNIVKMIIVDEDGNIGTSFVS
jgi:lysyl-tRNA synthetase class II